MDDRFRTVVADPPWNERGGGKIVRGAQRHYDLLRTKDIPSVMMESEVWGRVEETAHLYLWTTNNRLASGEAIWVAKELGFTPITVLTWVKEGRMGLGYYFRGTTEHVLFCRRGETVKTTGTWRTGFTAPKGRHSEKPETFFQMVEGASPGPWLEMFSRTNRPGWTNWGNEVPEQSCGLASAVKES